jgi:hypothetical protein
MGLMADPEVFRPKPVRTSQGVVKVPEYLEEISRSGVRHWQAMLYFGAHVPEVCWGDNAVNGFQKKQCNEFWNRLALGAALGLMPFGLVGLLYYLAMDSFFTIYRRGRKRVDSAQALASGTVTNPAGAPGDFFSRFYCFRTVGVQFKDGKQIKVYIPLDTPMPSPGSKLAVFKAITVMGELRHFAVVYAPHVAVVSGVRHA